MTGRWELNDEQSAVVKPVLRPIRRADNRARPWHDTRAVLNGVLWVLGTGVQWREKYPPYQTCHRRFQQWVRTGQLEEALKQLARHLHERGQLNLEEAFVDATFASAKKGAPPNRGNRSNSQDGRKLRRYCKRWKVERLFAWLHNFRPCHPMGISHREFPRLRPPCLPPHADQAFRGSSRTPGVHLVPTSKITLTSGGTASVHNSYLQSMRKQLALGAVRCSCRILSRLEDEFSSGEPEAGQIPGAVGLRSLRRRCCRRRCPLCFHELAIEASGDHLGAPVGERISIPRATLESGGSWRSEGFQPSRSIRACTT